MFVEILRCFIGLDVYASSEAPLRQGDVFVVTWFMGVSARERDQKQTM